ncbi:hypothetical protein B0181_00855 [Moraxella caviae]|uniref:Agglutination protein n=1 Tax=Moraxella caviae TaxID=34060 RepID=A0A1T0ABI2_9GAMM|nr:hypothetical protein B0181_00855 [Moraxella caviae]
MFLHAGALADGAVDSIQADFDKLKPSAYKDGAFRYRKYSKVRLDDGAVSLLPSEAFVQTGDINRFQGDVARTYDDLSGELLNSQGFQSICAEFATVCKLPAQSTMEVHQMRIIAQAGTDSVEAAPEGIHQDGFDFVGVFTIARHNHTGGELLVWRSQHDDSPLTRLNLIAGEFCIVNDKSLWHSASSLSAINGDDVGYWDLFVLTASSS